MPLVTLPRTGPGSGTGASPGNRAPSWPLRIDPAAPQAEGLLAAMVRVGRGFVDISPYRRGVTPSGIEAADWSATVLGAPAIALNDVNDRITHGYGNGVDPAVAPFSIAFWLVPNQASVDQIHASFGLTPRYYLGIVGANGTWDMGVGASGVGNGGDGPAVVVGASTHIVLDHDGTDVRRYVNGVLVGSKPWSGGAVSGDLAMGATDWGAVQPFTLLEARIYAGPLGAARIRQMYRAQSRWDLYRRPLRIFVAAGAGGTLTRAGSLEAVIRKQQQQIAGATAAVRAAKLQTSSVEAAIAARRADTTGASAAVAFRAARPSSLDAALRGAGVSSNVFEAVVQRLLLTSASLDAHLGGEGVGLRPASLDAIVAALVPPASRRTLAVPRAARSTAVTDERRFLS